MNKHFRKRFKKVPEFWWDIEWKNNKIIGIIIECDDPEHQIIKRFKGYNEKSHEVAEKFIDDLTSGRIDYRRYHEI